MWDSIIIEQREPEKARAVQSVGCFPPVSAPERRPLWRHVSRCALAAAAFALAQPSHALTLEFPGPANETASRTEMLGSYALPIGPWTDGEIRTRLIEGALSEVAWRIKAPDLTTLELIAPLRDQLIAGGFSILFECETTSCGGFDFRFATEVLPEPEMHVNLGDFRFLAAEHSVGTVSDVISLMVSRTSDTGFVQMIRVGETSASLAAAGTAVRTPLNQPLATAPLGDRLETGGAVALEDLTFESGSAELGTADFASLADLAAYLKANPERQVMLVGHTDAAGGLAGNVALSKKRAGSVRTRLIEKFGVSAAQVEADGVGFLVPRATNLTEEGRTLNRRVEVVLTSTQ